MNFRRFLTTVPLALLLIVPGRLAAQEKHPEHPKSKQQEHPTDKKQAGLTKEELGAAIKTWVEKEAAGNDGWLRVQDPVAQKTLQLKIEKVHDDRLSQVKPDVYFACADFVGKDGTKYDIDIFMQGKTKDDLQNTEVSVHKVNGKERYTWFEENGTWKKKPVE
ncbi:MAG TPA: hypothetical protein VGS98_02600 [Thermoanaerobaculia bacterium]|nr:hypothetical protein [Thermoanaerobaculia bacterium]